MNKIDIMPVIKTTHLYINLLFIFLCRCLDRLYRFVLKQLVRFIICCFLKHLFLQIISLLIALCKP